MLFIWTIQKKIDWLYENQQKAKNLAKKDSKLVEKKYKLEVVQYFVY